MAQEEVSRLTAVIQRQENEKEKIEQEKKAVKESSESVMAVERSKMCECTFLWNRVQ